MCKSQIISNLNSGSEMVSHLLCMKSWTEPCCEDGGCVELKLLLKD